MTPEKAKRSRPVGLEAEALVEQFFRDKGYEILARNHHSREGELDVVARTGELVVFVEVKARKKHSLVDPLASVTPSKQRKIVRAALDFVQRHQLEALAMRFDVVAVTLGGTTGKVTQIDHVEAAFDATAGDEPATERW